MRSPHRAPAGFSLVETAVAMIIVGVMLVASLQTVGALARRRHAAALADRGHGLAQALLDEVGQARYAESAESTSWGRESGEPESVRATWDDVDDYDTLLETTVRDQAGNEITGAAGWSRSVSVQLVNPADPATISGGDQGLKLIAVTVTDPRGSSTTLATLRSRHSSLDRLPATATDYLGWVGVDLTIGPDDATAINTGVRLLNSLPDTGGG